jgi:hypothetical protein
MLAQVPTFPFGLNIKSGYFCRQLFLCGGCFEPYEADFDEFTFV